MLNEICPSRIYRLETSVKTFLFLTLAVFSAAQPTTDKITKEVRHELVMLPYYGVFDNLAYRVDGTKVTLFGQVTKPTLKSDAERAVKRIEGVDRSSTTRSKSSPCPPTTTKSAAPPIEPSIPSRLSSATRWEPSPRSTSSSRTATSP